MKNNKQMSKEFLKLICITLIFLFSFAPCISAFAENVDYIYDDLNRLKRVEYGNGRTIEYTYDEVGNRTQKTVNAVGPAAYDSDGDHDVDGKDLWEFVGQYQQGNYTATDLSNFANVYGKMY